MGVNRRSAPIIHFKISSPHHDQCGLEKLPDGHLSWTDKDYDVYAATTSASAFMDPNEAHEHARASRGEEAREGVNDGDRVHNIVVGLT